MRRSGLLIGLLVAWAAGSAWAQGRTPDSATERELTRDEKRWLGDCLKALDEDSALIRRGAARALRCFGPEMLPELVKLSTKLRSDEGWTALADALSAMDRKTFRDRIEALREDWPRSRADHWEGILNRLRPPGGSAANPAVALKVREQLVPFQDTNTYTTDNESVKAIVALGRDAVPELLAILGGRLGPPLKADSSTGPFGLGSGGPSFVKEAAIEALCQLVTEEDRDELAALVAQGNYNAARPLSRIPGEETLDALLAPVQNGMFDHQLLAALDPFADSPRLRRTLIAYLDEYGRAADYDVGLVADFVGGHSMEEAVPALRRVLAFGGEDSTRVSVSRALVTLGCIDGIEELLKVFEKPSDRFGTWARASAGNTLNEICGKRIFLSREDDNTHETLGNWSEAAQKFRAWWETAKGTIHWDAEARRWVGPTPD